MPVLKSIALTSFYVTNWEQAKHFYGDVLGLPCAFISEDIGWAQYGPMDGVQVAINLWRGPDPVPPQGGGGTLVFNVDDAGAAAKALKAAGVKVGEVQVIPGMVNVVDFYDPEGNHMQAVSMVRQQ